MLLKFVCVDKKRFDSVYSVVLPVKFEAEFSAHIYMCVCVARARSNMFSGCKLSNGFSYV